MNNENKHTKPDCPLIGEDGNIFHLVGIAAKILKRNGLSEEASEMTNKVFASGSYAGLRAMLYYFNGKALEAVGEDRISDEGTAEFEFTHASDYLIVIGEVEDSDAEENNPETGDTVQTWILTLIASMAVIIGACLSKRSKNET